MAFQVVAVAILLLFYGCYLLKMVRQRKKGIKTDQMGKGKVGIVKVIELTTKAATYTVFVIEHLVEHLFFYDLCKNYRRSYRRCWHGYFYHFSDNYAG